MRGYFVIVPLLLGGCVTQGKYDDLKRQYDEAREQLGAGQEKIGSLEQAIAAEQAQVKELREKIAQTEQQRAALQQQGMDKDGEIARLRNDGQQLTDQLAKVVKDRSALKESTDQLSRALRELALRKAEAERRIAEYRSLLVRFKNLIDAGKLQVKIVEGKMVLELPTDVLFDTGSARLSKPGKEALVEVAQVLEGMPDRRFQVEGHTDNVPIHNARYASNWELASGRALGVIRAMTEAGMDRQLLSGASYGEYHPVAGNDTDAGKAKNRRIEIVLVPDLSMLPGYDDLNHMVEGK
ncbi:MAG: OmpA family protein [Polyangiales bacterium]